MEQRRLGKFQIEVGWLLVVISIVIGIVGYWIILTKLVFTFSGLTKTWSDIEVLPPEFLGHIVSYTSLLSSIFFIGTLLLAVMVFLLFCIGILFITQGTANANLAKSVKKEEISLTEAKRKFRRAFAVSFVFMLLCTLLFFNPFYDYVYGPDYGVGFGFPSEYAYFINSSLSEFSLYGFIINLLFALVVSYGIGLIYYRLILGFKKF
ncbi:MAG: hypothetical protein Q8R04_01705 [Nanoarchaeota archaeon]|nr:hypothetical protein [Nanoarchaeota archaeon]